MDVQKRSHRAPPPLDVTFIGAYSLRTFGGGVKWFIKLLNLLRLDGRIRPHLFVQDYVDYGRVKQCDIEEMVCFDYHEMSHESGELLPNAYNISTPSNSHIFGTVYVMTDRPQILQKAMEIGDRVIFGAHDPYLLRLEGEKRCLFQELWSRVDAIHILSPAQGQFSQYNPNLYVLPNTWLGQPVPNSKKFSKFTVIFFSRHEMDKGIDIVERVARSLPEDINLYIAGSGTATSRVSQVHRSNVHVMGFISENELYSVLAKSHAVLFPSRCESGLAMVAVEALAHHTPLVYWDMTENWILRRHPLNLAVNSDVKFLEGLAHLKNLYETDRGGYLQLCSELPSLLQPGDSYVENFVDLLTRRPRRGWDDWNIASPTRRVASHTS